MGLIFLLFKGLSRVFSKITNSSALKPSLWSNSHIRNCYWKNHTLTRWTFGAKGMSLHFNMLLRFIIAFLPRSQVSFNFMIAVTICSDFGAQENIGCHCFHCFPIYLPWSDGTRGHNLRFLNVEFKPTFSLSSFTFIKKLFSSSLLSAIRVVSSLYLICRWHNLRYADNTILTHDAL